MLEAMATHDTDPQRAPTIPADADATTEPTTQPGAPPDVVPVPTGGADVAASLLADLARAPLPAENVRETQGHAAAAFAVAPHRPPRANDPTIEDAAVVVNATVEVPAAAGRAGEPTLRDAATVPGLVGYDSTPPTARTHAQRRGVLYASFGGALVAAIVASVIAVASVSSSRTTTTSAEGTLSASVASKPLPAAASATSPASPMAAAKTPSAPTAPTTPTLAGTSAPTTAAEPAASAATSAPRPTGTGAKPSAAARPPVWNAPAAPPVRPARSSGRFEEPDRTF